MSVDLFEAFVKISAKGFDAAKSQLLSMVKATEAAQAKIKAFQDKVDKIGNIAAKQFAIGTAGILGFVKVASPGDFQKFEAAVARVSVQIGSLFLPVVRSLTFWLNKLADTLNKLTPKQREQIGHWARTALVIAGVTAATMMLSSVVLGLVGGLTKAASASIYFGSKLAGGMAQATRAAGGLAKSVAGLGGKIAGGLGQASKSAGGLFGSLAKSLTGIAGLGASTGGGGLLASVLGSTAYVGAIIAAVAALVAALAGVAAIGVVVAGRWESVKKSFVTIFETAKRAALTFWNAVKPIFVVVGDMVAQFLDKLAQVYQRIGPMAERVFQQVAKVVNEFKPLIEDLADAIMGFADDALEALVPLQEMFYDGLLETIRALLPVVKFIFQTITNEIRKTLNELRVFARVAKAIVDDPAKALDLSGTIKVAQMEVDRADRERRERNKNLPKDSEAKEQGPIQVYKPELSGIAEAMRKAQTSALGDSPELTAARERIRIAKQSDDKLSRIDQNIAGLKLGLQ